MTIHEATKQSPPQGRASGVPDGAVQNRISFATPDAHVHGQNVFEALCPKLFRSGTSRIPESRGYPSFGFSGSIKMLAKIDLLSLIRAHVVSPTREFKPSHRTPAPKSNLEGSAND